MALKRPHAISFSKKNVVRPFEDASSLEFWAQKNDASLFVVGQTTKKRPDGMVFVRMYDGRVLDMCEVGVDRFVSMQEFKVCFFAISRARSPCSAVVRLLGVLVELDRLYLTRTASFSALPLADMLRRHRNRRRDTSQ